MLDFLSTLIGWDNDDCCESILDFYSLVHANSIVFDRAPAWRPGFTFGLPKIHAYFSFVCFVGPTTNDEVKRDEIRKERHRERDREKRMSKVSDKKYELKFSPIL